MPELNNNGHIDRALTNISVAYMQAPSVFISASVFPIIGVTKQTDVYFEYSKADMFRNEVQERGRGAESVGGNWALHEADPYHCRKFAFHYDITQEERVNFDSPINIERDTTQWLANKMLLKREVDFANKFYKPGIWGKDISGVSGTPTPSIQVKKWSDQTSDPVQNINDQMLYMAQNTGYKPNFAIMSPDVFYALKNHEAIMDRIKYTQKGIVTIDLIASLFEIDNIYIPWAIQNTGPQTPTYDETLTAMSFIYSGKLLLGYKAARPALKEPSAGYIFAWTGLEGSDGAYGSRMVRIPMDQLGYGTERFEMEMAYDQKVICKDMGIFFSDLV